MRAAWCFLPLVSSGLLFAQANGFDAIDEDDVVRIMRSLYTMIASDADIPVFGQASPHPRSYERLKLWDRGLLRPGHQ